MVEAVPEVSADEVWIGIDLGTTNSCVGIWRDQKVEIVQDETGAATIPSVVAFKETGQKIVGTAAVNQLIKNLQNTLYDSKRLLGFKYDHPKVQKNLSTWPFTLAKGRNGITKFSCHVEG